MLVDFGEMADPILAAVLKKLLALDTPFALRICETALLFGLIVGASYVRTRVQDPIVFMAAYAIGVFGFLLMLARLFSLIASLVEPK